jgi:CHAT domain-containing protein
MARRAAAIVAGMALLALASAPADGRAGAPGLDRCLAEFAARPDAEASAKCFSELAEGADVEGKEAVIAAATELSARHPGAPWLLYYLGWMRWREPESAAGLFRAAVEEFARRGDDDGEARARYNLANLLGLLGQTEDAARERDRVIDLAGRSGDPLLRALGAIVEAKGLRSQMRDLDRARELLVAVEPTLFPDGPFQLQKEWLLTAGVVALEFSRLDEATAHFTRLLDLARARDMPYLEATALYNLMSSTFAELSQAPAPGARAELVDLARQALAVAAASRNADVESKVHLVLAMLSRGDEAREHADGCLRVARSDPVRSYCLAARARAVALDDPAAALDAIEQAIELADRVGDPWARAFAWGVRMRVSWTAGSRSRAVEDSWAALDAIEVLRDLQSRAEARGEVFAPWTDDYAWFAGRLLKEYVEAGGGEELLDQAHRVAERMRARALIDALEAAGAAPPASEATADRQRRLAGALTEIDRVRRRLTDPDLAPPRREAWEIELARLELSKARLQEQLDGAAPDFAALRRPSFASLAEVRAALDPDQALLSFVVAPQLDLNDEFAGGGWLVTAHRGGVRVYPALERTRLRPAVELFNGLFEPRDGGEAKPAGRLAQKLLSTALRDLPPEVDRLIVIPDDFLHLLPFAALRDGTGELPLASRYRVTVVPSATLWLRWSRNRPAPAPVPALVLADPLLPDETPVEARGDGGGGSSARACASVALPRFGRLWQSEREGRAVLGYLDGGSTLRLRGEASESSVKTTDLSRFTVVHFATHAVTDDECPARSAVLLAPGSPDDDGLLQLHEIVDLDLDGRVVVLSSCRSASGEVLRGEGVMGLARAFFQAGAHAVVASLWPLEDEDAALLFERFYRHLAAGASVAGALAAAQRDRLAAGAPGAAWAGLVVLGDGDLVPVPGGVRRAGAGVRAAIGAAVVLALVAALAALFGAARSRRRGSTPGLTSRGAAPAAAHRRARR